MLFKLRKILIIIFIFSLPIVVSADVTKSDILYTSSELFPLPKSLEPAVNFWIKIYTEYHTNEYVLHDSRNLSIIYEVVTFGTPADAKMDLPQTRAQRNALKKKTKEYKNLLLRLASKKTDFDKLEGEEKRVFEVFGESRNRNDYRTAASRIRIQKGQKNRFQNGLQISGQYMDHIIRIFDKCGVPKELAMLPHVESSFNHRAYSSAGAAGLWQFTRGTGRRFLKISYEIDERLDPLIATEAAAKLLKENYEKLQSWPLAITAYNSGTAGMNRAKNRLKTSDISIIIDNYKSRRFKFASRNFYCEFLAALHIAQNHEKYFSEIQFLSPLQYQEYQLPHFVKASTIGEYFKLDREEIQKYNPALRNPIFEGSKYLPKDFRLKLPSYLNPEELYAQIPQDDLYLVQKRSQWYQVRRGDTLGEIARRNKVTISSLMALNNISNAHKIRSGERLRLPDETKLENVSSANESVVAVDISEEIKSKETIIAVGPSVPKITEVEKTETIIAKPKNIEKTKPKIDLELGPVPDRALLTHTVEIVKGKNSQEGYIIVESDETLGHFADWLKIPTQNIRNWNDIAYGTDLNIGQKLKLYFDKVSVEDFNLTRFEYHRGIEEDFFNNYNVIGTSTHKIKKGENIWYLCNIFDLPYWVIKSYNNDLNLNSLKPGDLILIPEISEIKPKP